MVELTQKPGSGIGWGRRSLKSLLEEDQHLYQETGCYFGLKDLPLSATDPMKLELFHSRLLSATIAGREMTRMISASPQVREMSELAVALYTPEGDCVLQSTGIIIHIPLMGQVIQWMINQGYENEGIRDGDCYTSNDPIIAGMHPLDVYDIQPIFHEQKLIGWVGCVIMELEIGALTPGGVPAGATDRFVDGLKFSCEKSAVDDRHLKSFERRVRFGLRNVDTFLLDRKGALAADIKVRTEIVKIIQDFGIDYYMQAVRELIEVERRAQLERVKRRTVPGKFHSPSTIEICMSRSIAPPHLAKDRITLVPWDFHIRPDGTYFLDFDGAGSWGWHIHNCTPSVLIGAACMILTQTISYTGKSNHGTFLNIGFNAPYDTFVNPSTRNIPSSNFFAWPLKGGPKFMAQQSHAFFCRGYVEEVRTGNIVISGSGGTMIGINHFGQDFSMMPLDPSGGMGSGAFAIRDGIISEGIFMPDTDMGNVEIWELMLPMLWLGRKIMPDSCGYGKYRSGYSMTGTHLIYKTPLMEIETGSSAQTDKIYPYMGMFGGYPGHHGYMRLLLDTNVKQLIQEKKPLVHGNDRPGYCELEHNLQGKSVLEVGAGYFVKDPIKDGDILQGFYGAIPSGFGDPLKRDLKLVKKDLDSGYLTIESCRRIYGVEAACNPQTGEWTVDEKATNSLRTQKKQQRISQGVSTAEWWRERRRELLENRPPAMVRRMYNDSLSKGKRWSKEYRDFWNLSADFVYKEN